MPDAVKQRYLEATVTDTVVTKQVDGHPQRVIRTELVDHLEGAGPHHRAATVAGQRAAVPQAERPVAATTSREEGLAMKKSQDLSWAQVAMAANAPMLTKAALVDGNLDAGVLPTGQVVGVIDALPTVASIIETIVHEAERTLTRLGAGD